MVVTHSPTDHKYKLGAFASYLGVMTPETLQKDRYNDATARIPVCAYKRRDTVSRQGAGGRLLHKGAADGR